jgi:hypothetical protein
MFIRPDFIRGFAEKAKDARRCEDERNATQR